MQEIITMMNRRWAGRILPLLCVVSVLCSCQRYHTDEKFKHAISHTLEYPPGMVVSVVQETVGALKLRVLSKSTTNIDGRFEVRSAMGDEYRILVEGVRTDKTRIEIDMPTRHNADQAKLIMAEISSRVRYSRPRPASHQSTAPLQRPAPRRYPYRY